MTYAEWQQSILGRRRGGQRWASRLRVYEHVRRNPEVVTGEVGALCRKSDTAPSTFYVLFGKDSPDRLVEGDPMEVVLAETKNWSLSPYLAGVGAGGGRVQASARTLTDALLRAACEWCFDEPALAAANQAAPPQILIEDLEKALEPHRRADPEAFRGALADIARSALFSASTSDSESGSALEILNTVRPKLAELLGEVGDAPATGAVVGVIEALTDYADQLAQSDDPNDARTLTELRPIFERFLLLIPHETRP